MMEIPLSNFFFFSAHSKCVVVMCLRVFLLSTIFNDVCYMRRYKKWFLSLLYCASPFSFRSVCFRMKGAECFKLFCPVSLSYKLRDISLRSIRDISLHSIRADVKSIKFSELSSWQRSMWFNYRTRRQWQILEIANDGRTPNQNQTPDDKMFYIEFTGCLLHFYVRLYATFIPFL